MDKYEDDSFIGVCPMCGQKFLKEEIDKLKKEKWQLTNELEKAQIALSQMTITDGFWS